ncbi:ATP-dependent 6-phosphofructokinase [Desulfosarcina ovata subsp. sediminis]|uniref:ATP-dependent 6-phosphofructokinase n=1 Tax=Desulfosarcina ovata subsp. sediminis TaxID=885957 RepID=A0A5K7ZEX6_9BACT|nr:ATP-dependent 6-phosphofructokinase [Desulfosarcina ovata]BBO80612.1 ATP-dependent 6-phosphofructokinase [Desulfosarcina ovata subsp. sediminis]
MNMEAIETPIQSLGEAKIPSPMLREDHGGIDHSFVSDDDRILINIKRTNIEAMITKGISPPAFELAGPRRKVYFDAAKLRCAVATCGGLCPGLNDIIRAIVLELHYRYGVKIIYGVRHGLEGFIPEYNHDFLDLTAQRVSDINNMGGTILGSSRGAQDIDRVVDCLEVNNIGILFMVGGDGTLMAASKIADTISQRGLKISVVGIPKTIDNDIHLVSRSFGFDTAVDVSRMAIQGAHNEAISYPNGVGLIKLMGRHSGFIAATAALAQQDANFVLIPEVDFDLDGPKGLMAALETRLASRGHAVIVAAEGAGQKFFTDVNESRDASGNIRLNDIGPFLRDTIKDHFTAKKIPINIKYIDPSYMIRSLPANANDSVFCGFLGRDAVHAGMAGKTKLVIGHWNNHFVHLPMEATAGKRKQVRPRGKLWTTVLESTGQPPLKNDHT